MGLFGGFKAKFTKDSKSKEKLHNNVVVLKYHCFSEFDATDHHVPPVNTIKKNGVVHDNQKHKQRPNINSAAFDNSTSNKLNEIKKALSMRNVQSNNTPTVSKSRSENELRSTDDKPSKPETSSGSKEDISSKIPFNGRVDGGQNELEKQEPPISGISETVQLNKTLSKSPTSTTINNKNENEYIEQSTLISMTQQQPEAENGASIEEDIYGTREDFIDHYKVNVVQHDTTKIPSFSEDEISYVEDEGPSNVWSDGFSNQAESIFFQGDMHPTINRPRRVFLQDDEDEDDSDSEDKDNEADC
ncbi:uncharacterized protein [Leptinotarsa decemlineata]|uniref:uncharacterized protein n=1 Tax=Leptinotarsa decemlineata TaxID=7539 RepID=UPI003D30859A